MLIESLVCVCVYVWCMCGGEASEFHPPYT